MQDRMERNDTKTTASGEGMKQTCLPRYRNLWLLMLGGIIFCSLLLHNVQAHALEQIQIPLTKFNTPGIVKLGDNNDSYSIKVPSPRRWQIEEASLHLAYVNSTALLASRSRLVILFNDYPLGQVTLEPEAPEGIITVSIPVRLFEVGYNTLQIQVAQDFKDEGCIPPNPPEVWTILEFIDSTLELSYTQKEVPLSLASVADFLFDPKISGKNRVHIVTETMESDDVNLAVTTAAAVALRFNYRPVLFSSGKEIKQDRDNIVIGTHSFLQKVIGNNSINGDIGILPMPGASDIPDRLHGLIYLSGSDAEEIRKSVNAFSILSLPMPDIQSCQVTEVQLPIITPYSGKNRLAPEKRFTFKELGFQTTTFRGYRDHPAKIEFTLPTDLYLEENRDILIRLNLSYAAAMREDSVLSLNVNEEFIASVPLDRPEGGQYRGYVIRLPLSYLSPGRNVLTFNPLLTPLHTGKCALFQTDNLALTLFNTSTIQIPKLMHWVKLPQLSYLFNDGFPLTAKPDFSETTLMLPRQDRKSLATALNFIGGISQKTGVLPYRLTFTSKIAEAKGKNLLVIGPRGELPKEILNASPLAKGISMPVYGRLPGTLREGNWQDRIRQWLFDEVEDLDPVTPDIATLGTDLRIRPRQAVLCEFESPFTPAQSVILLTAENADDVLQASHVLQDNEVTQQCRNSFVLIDFERKKPAIQVAALTPSYSVGEVTVRNRITYLVEKFRWPFIVSLIVLLTVLALLLTILLKKRRNRRMQMISEKKEE